MAGFMEGMEPEMLPVTPVSDPYIDAMAWTAVVVALIVLPTSLRLWRLFINSLVRRSESKLPAAERTLSERLSQLGALLLSFLLWAFLLYCASFRLHGGQMALTPASGVGVLTGACLGAYLLQVVGYYLVGYAFSTPPLTDAWLRALNAVQAIEGFLILLPAFAALLFPGVTYWCLALSAGIFILVRILLWAKGFTIFYTGPFSIFYFFLYLCTLEMVPLLLPLGVAFFIC